MRAPAIVAAALALGLWAGAAEAQVRGRVVDPSGAGVQTNVLLQVHDGAQVIYSAEAATDTQGLAVWSDVPEGDNLQGRLVAPYDGAEYASPSMPLEAGAGDIELVVHPVMREGRPLHLDTLHLIVQVDDPSVLRVLQFMTISNASEAAFGGGPALADGRRAGLVVPLPAGATNVQAAPFPNAAGALPADQAQFDSDRVLDPRPVPPGGRQVAVTYELAVNDGLDAALVLPYPTQSISLLLGGAALGTLEFGSDVLDPQGTESIGEEQYDLWGAQALAPGTEVSLRIGEPGFSLTPSQWGLLGTGLGLLLAIAGSVWGGRSPGLARQQRDEIIAAIAALDDARDRDEIDDSDYFHRRSRELERLALLGDVGGGDAGAA